MYDYQEVHYSHLPVGPGASYLLTADPWSFLHAELERRAKGTRGGNADNHRRARYYARLAEGFYAAGRKTSLPTSATLAYYGMLNLTKCWLSLRGTELETRNEHHGASLPRTSKLEVEVQSVSRGSVGIFQEFVQALAGERPSKQTQPFVTLCSHIPELHEIAFATGHLPNRKRKFLPIEIQFKVSSSKKHVFTEVRYSKKHEARVRAKKFHSGARAEYLKPMAEQDGYRVFRSAARKSVTKENWARIYRNIQREYSGLDLASILTRNGYRYYCDLEPGEYPHLANTLLCAFYLGSVARYRPLQAERLLESDLRPLVSEFMSLCPDQFLYQLVGQITEQICVVPMAKL